MRSKKAGGTFVIRLDRGEEIIGSLTDFCTENGIKNAHFSAIGAVDRLSCGYYSLAQRQYNFRSYEEMLEVIALTGNVFLKEDRPFIHTHGVFSNQENQAFGGHVESARVGLVLEVILTQLPSALEREYDKATGLALIDIPSLRD